MGGCSSQCAMCLETSQGVREGSPATAAIACAVPLRRSSEETSWSTVSCHHDFFSWLARPPKRTPPQSAQQRPAKMCLTETKLPQICDGMPQTTRSSHFTKWKTGNIVPPPNRMGWPLFTFCTLASYYKPCTTALSLNLQVYSSWMSQWYTSNISHNMATKQAHVSSAISTSNST